MSLPTTPTAARRVTIAHDAALSSAVSLGGNTLVGLRVLGGWTAAPLTFQEKDGDGNWLNVLDDEAAELTIADPSGAAHIVLDPARYASLNNMRIRSGTSGSTVNQEPGEGQSRVIELIVRLVQ